MREQKKRTIKIDNVELESNIILSPLAGVTDRAFRSICNEYPLGYSYTEMVSAKGLLYNDEKSKELIMPFENERNLGIQIFGSDPQVIKTVIEEKINPLNLYKTIDLNMGCPVPKIVKNGEGSALMKNPELVKRIIYSMKEVSQVPITVKIRLGFDEDNMNFLEIAKIAEEYGASMVTIHGRTRKQMYSGKADWKSIKILKEELNIPVIGNGDVFTPEDAEAMIQQTGVDGIALARGAMGKPFLFKQIEDYFNEGNYKIPTIDELVDIIEEHYNRLIHYKGEKIAINEMRKHIAWYLKGYRGSNALKNKINQAKSKDDVFNLLEKYRKEYGNYNG